MLVVVVVGGFCTGFWQSRELLWARAVPPVVTAILVAAVVYRRLLNTSIHVEGDEIIVHGVFRSFRGSAARLTGIGMKQVRMDEYCVRLLFQSENGQELRSITARAWPYARHEDPEFTTALGLKL